ncbi:hypothetical protein SAMN05216466_106158 [Paraburkholderia phenazinium]|uniref:Uncharacterized protein n=1 Tax=Paraburkholderia phenazinium TaxID=60549 RepID=A0A1G7YFB9_9BURK|nr:hypothetical protein [Paraburkholderia phenazinium]SDG95027.1 hypothetical protein SAMN05216466_106158 [Paraburkholderia phenazinium]
MTNQPRIEGITEQPKKGPRAGQLVDILPVIREAGSNPVWIAEFLIPQEMFDGCVKALDAQGAKKGSEGHAQSFWTMVLISLLMGGAQPTIVLALPDAPGQVAPT